MFTLRRTTKQSPDIFQQLNHSFLNTFYKKKILDKQNDDKETIHVGHDNHLGMSKAGTKSGQTRQRLKAPRLSNKKIEDIELQRPLVSV